MSAPPPPPPPSTPPVNTGGGGVASSLISHGLSSSLHGSATTFGTPQGSGFGSAFQSSTPGRTPSGYNMSSISPPPPDGAPTTPGTPLTARGDRRSKLVRERSRSSAAFASSSRPSPGGLGFVRGAPGTASPACPQLTVIPSNAAVGDKKTNATMEGNKSSEDEHQQHQKHQQQIPPLFTSFCYRGMEVIFTAINCQYGNDRQKPQLLSSSSSSCHLLGIHARTRAPFQKCFLPNTTITNNTSKASSTTTRIPPIEIVQLTSHPTTGYIFAADNLGNIHSFHPVRSDPMVEPYGKFRWIPGSVARCREVFGYPPLFSSPWLSKTGGDSTDMELDGAGLAAGGEDAVVDAGPTLTFESSEDGFEISSDTFSIDKRMASSVSNEGMTLEQGHPQQEKKQQAVCFYRRRKQQQPKFQSKNGTTVSPRSSLTGKNEGSYPLSSDGQPPFPSENTDGGGSGSATVEYGVKICASMTERRVLIVHKDQLAVFDFALPVSTNNATTLAGVPPPLAFQSVKNGAMTPPPPSEAQLLWTHKLQNTYIDHASFSGDGCAIAVVLRGEGVGVPYPFGVRTFVRDMDDGSNGVGVVGGGASSSSGGGNAAAIGDKKKSNAAAAANAASSAPSSKSGGGKPPIHNTHRRTGSGMISLPVHHSPPLPNNRKMLENVFGDAAAAATPNSSNTANNSGPTTAPLASSGGMAPIAKQQQQQQGILYKPAQFLVHSAPVTRLSFRGYGTLTSSAQHNNSINENNTEEGNDLLLTTCTNDNSLRIFSQNSWRQLMHWNSPPKSRADWVRGISAANLGDLDSSQPATSSSKKNKEGQLTPIPKDMDASHHSRNSKSSTNQHHHHDASSVYTESSDDASGGINRALLASKQYYHHASTMTPKSPGGGPGGGGAVPSHSVPGTHAGAWISELTFRNGAFPALRLSRLSYMKTGGDDALPAHFESVAAILPPGSLMEELILENNEDEGGMGECRMDVEGIWPAWDPWEQDLKGGGMGGGGGSALGDATKDGTTDGNKGGTSNPLGGAPGSSNVAGSPTANNNMTPRWLGDGLADLGGSHMPPSELRITSCSPHSSNAECITQIEMPLWGDKDFGAMEFGAPMRYVMMMPAAGGCLEKEQLTLPLATLEYESGSRLCATSSNDGRSIDLSWRRHGAVNLEEITNDGASGSSAQQQSKQVVRRFQDLSLIPLPLSLPSLTLPRGCLHYAPNNGVSSSAVAQNLQPSLAATVDKHAVSSLHWWPDENYGGPPRLVATTHSGTIIVYEMPPPWSALEPPMPSYDPFDEEGDSRGSSVDGGDSDYDLSDDDEGSVPMIDDEGIVSMGSLGSRGRSDYELCIAPHPDFGLGLRLEAQAIGMPPMAGSFKKHPLSGGRLPAERCGVIALGDELLAVNEVSLEGMKFEDAIATVRQIGFDSFGAPLQMRFRRCSRGKRFSGSLFSKSMGSNKSGSGGGRRSTLDSRGSGGAKDVIVEGTAATGDGGGGGCTGSLATVEVGADAEIQQGFGRIIAIVRDAIVADIGNHSSSPNNCQQATITTPPAMLLRPWNFGKGATVSQKMYGGALILWAVPGSQKRIIKAARLEAVLDIDPENARFVEMGSISLKKQEEAEGGAGKSTAVKSISFISSTEKGWLVAIHDCDGNVSLLFVETASTPSGATIRATFRHYPCIFNSYGTKSTIGNNNKHDPRDTFILRSFSLELFGGMNKACGDGGCKELNIWEALPQSMHGNADEGSTTTQSLEYISTTISIDNVPQLSDDDEVMLDFKWVSSGFVDAFPWLVTFTQSAAVVYHRSGIQTKWLPIAIFSYKENLLSTGILINPHDSFPHLVTALRCAALSNDEQGRRMKSDWHPESILANICTEEGGAKLALKSSVQGLYTWLSQWMNTDESMRPSWDGHGPLSNAPFRIVNDKTVLSSDDDDEKKDDGPGETSATLLAAMSLNNPSAAKPQSEEEILLSELQTALCPTDESNVEPKKNGTIGRSKEFMLAMSYGKGKTEKGKESEKQLLPIPIQSLNNDELCCIWAIGDILSNPPSFKKLDPLSQLCLFCVTLMRRLLDRETGNSMKAVESVGSMPDYEGGRPMFMRQSSSMAFEKEKATFDYIASSAVLAALMSDNQAKLLDCCRPKGEKFSWESARAIKLPYWVRSEKMLASVAEEIAQTIYKSTKSVMDCALYYVAMRNMKKLQAIAATDRSLQGKKFLKFIIDHDFSSDRGRSAAEKNAYSLLGKRKYLSAASFFLLAEPPMIKTALDVIKSQLDDPSLAFFVARLMENAPKSSSAMSGGSLTIGGGFNLSSMGGGGGFAGSGSIIGGASPIVAEEETIKFDSWKPTLGKHARSVLLPKDSPDKDICFESLQLLWLGRPNEATLRLSHLPASGAAKKNVTDEDLPFPPVFSSSEPADVSENTRVLKKTNEIINFCSGPTLLKRMKPKKRVLWTSSLLVSRALSRCGIDIPSMRILLQFADPSYKEDDSNESDNAQQFGTAQVKVQSSSTPSSIFDSYDTAPAKPKPGSPKQPEAGAMPSSIFDSFDAAPPKPKAAPKLPSNPMSSSIFDSFDAAPPKPKAAPKPPSDPMSSSIFDSFDAAPPKPKAAPKPPSDPMSSSIFDSFDAAPPKPKAVPKPPSDPMSSSIFDSFDAAPPKPKAAPNPPSDPMSSSIFDSFDSAPQKRTQKPSALAASKAHADATAEVEKEQPFNIPSCPELWNDWRERLIHVVAARRFLRELARIISSFDGEPNHVAMEDFAQRNHPVVPTGAAEVLRNACDSEGLLTSIFKSLSELSASFGIDETVIAEQALELLSTTRQPRRIVFAVILQCILGRGDLAEDLVRDAASFQMNSSEFLGFTNDTIVDNRETRYYTSSLWARRDSSSVIWQLELCLWLYRGGAFDLSSIAMKETLLAVRVGLAVAAWGRCHHSLDTLIKAEPDCLMDFDSGKNLWRSMKIIVVNDTTVDGIDGVTSGGWEFLVDCRREEATEMLRDGKTGQFLIRPHPQDPGVFTLSFKTNLVPTEPTPSTNYDEAGTMDKPQETPPTSANSQKVVKRDDVVQHAIIRLSDSGFRCGSFGPFATLVKLLHAVSGSLPFELRFGDPPIKGIISEKGTQTSPNSFLFRKMALHSKSQFFQFQSTRGIEVTDVDDCLNRVTADDGSPGSQVNLHQRFGLFSQLMFLTELRKQLCAVASAVEDDPDAGDEINKPFPDVAIDDDFDGSITEGSLQSDDEEALGVATRMVKPLLNWVRSREIDIVDEVTPVISGNKQMLSPIKLSVAINATGDELEVPPSTTGGDSMIRRMIQTGSGVDFRTLRVGEAGNSVIVVLFGKQDAIKWLMSNETGNDEAEAKSRLKAMELMRIIEPIASSDLSIPKSYAASHPSTESRYRFVDPWEVEALESRSGETASAALGRGRYQKLSVGLIANSCEKIVRAAGGLHLLGLWSTLKGGITLTKALCSAHPSWERDAGGDLLMKKGFLMEPSPYDNSIRQHLYGNYLFRRLGLPQRFLALVQVELLDLKNVTSPSGSSSLTAYALLRLKRQGSSAPLNHKARSLDSACTQARKISKSSGPNAPASWGSLVRFRFPLPEDVNCEGRSFDTDRESLFKGSPTCLQITVYEKKFMSDVELGGADVNLESLGSGGQVEEWVPLRAGKDGITWFARIRLSLRFELMCLDSSFDTASETGKDVRCPSVGLKKIQKLSRLGAHEDHKQGVKNSISTPDLMGYFGNILY
ncbi:hypothetical protein ACHAXR_013156 [Thalassiosira sp. AJA248-18]